MNLSVVYRVFVRDFRKQKKRITLTLIALAWGTISIMLLLAFGEGLHQQLAINQKGLGEGIVILWANQTTIPYKGLGKGRNLHFLQEDIDYLKKSVPGIKEVGGEYSRWGVEVRHATNVVSEHITGITPNYEQMRSHFAQAGGRMINQLDLDLRRRVAFIGHNLKERLFGDSQPVGKTIFIQDLPFTVIGVMLDKMQMGAYSGMDENMAAIPITTFETAFGHRYLNNILYQPASLAPKDMEATQKQVFEAFGAKYQFDPNDERALWVWDVVEGHREFNNVLIGIKIFLGIIGGLTLLIAGVGVANIMYVSIKERTREIGIKMAVGARRAYILVQFLIEAFMITFLGGFGGMAVSYILTEAFKRVPIESDVMDFMGRPTLSLEIGAIVVAILGLMGLISGLFPAMRAASVSPVESLRYE